MRRVAALLLALAACAPPGGDEPAGGRGGEGGRPSVPGECIEDIGQAGLQVSWAEDVSAPSSRAELTLVLKNPLARSAHARLALIAFGLDERRVIRPYGDFTLAPGEERRQPVLLRDLPIQGRTTSSEATLEVILDDRGDDAVRVYAPSFHYHFPQGFGSAVVYDLFAMVEQFGGGQLTDDAFSLHGRVWTGARFEELHALRAREHREAYGLPAPPAYGVFTDFTPPPPPPPQPEPGGSGWFDVCVDWRAHYLDAGLEEDIAKDGDEQLLDASYARYELRRVTTNPCISKSPSPGPSDCETVLESGYLDAAGCTKFTPPASSTYALYVWSQMKRLNLPAEVHLFTNPSPADPTNASLQTDKGVQRWRLSFFAPLLQNTPLPPFVTKAPGWSLAQNGAAILSRALVTPGLGLVVPPAGKYTMRVNTGCKFDQPYLEGCGGNPMHSGVAYKPDGTPGHLFYKFLVAHELGHMVQGAASGLPSSNFEVYDAVPSPAACRCDHVLSANHLHCMQSLETSSAAQSEGFAHFLSSRLFNLTSGDDCAFQYYKELRTTGGAVLAPPVTLDCRDAARWRDATCWSDDGPVQGASSTGSSSSGT